MKYERQAREGTHRGCIIQQRPAARLHGQKAKSFMASRRRKNGLISESVRAADCVRTRCRQEAVRNVVVILSTSVYSLRRRLQLRFDSTAVRLLIKGHQGHCDVTRYGCRDADLFIYLGPGASGRNTQAET